MKNSVIKVGNKKVGKWFWPSTDGGDIGIEHPNSTWKYMLDHPDVPTLVSEYVPNKGVVVQAGGNCGFYVKQYAQLFNVVYTFEPDPLNFYCLNLNVTERNVIKFQACLGEKHEMVSLGNYLNDSGSTHVKNGPGEQSVVPTMLIDDLNLSSCDLIHLDIEGYELFALKGAIETIKKFKPVIVYENPGVWSGRYGYNRTTIDEFVMGLGYSFKCEEQGDMIFTCGG